MDKLTLGLCEGRHSIPNVTDYIFPSEINPTDLEAMWKTIAAKIPDDALEIDLYVTGLTVALVEVINYCRQNDIDLTLYHFNRDTNGYYPQVANHVRWCPFCHHAFGKDYFCGHCGAS